MAPKKRCSVCRKLFLPDPRVGARQHACREKHCQRQRRAHTQASWRSRNPSYHADDRLKRRAATAAAAAAAERSGERDGDPARDPPACPPAALRVPAVLASFPWDFAYTTLGFAGADLLASLALLLVRVVNVVKDEKMAERPLSTEVYGLA